MEFPEPTLPIDDERQVLLGYLDYFRAVLLEKAPGPGVSLPSGWTVRELVNHLRHVERRWLEWGFEGVELDDPWADSVDKRWHTDDELPTLIAKPGGAGPHHPPHRREPRARRRRAAERPLGR